MKIPVLTYHKLSKNKEDNRYTILENDFLSHLEFLYGNNYKCILVDDYYLSLLDPLSKLPPRSVIITFDDGHESDYKIALPHLKKIKFKGNFFITTDWIGKPGYVNQEQLRTLKAEGMSVQSHAKTHLFLDEMESDGIYHELKQSKSALEDILGKKVSFLSLPGGRYNRRVIDCARDLDYSAVLSSVPFSLRKVGDIYLIGRVMVRYTSDNAYFEKIVKSNSYAKMKLKGLYYWKYYMKKVLGNYVYHFLWKRYVNRGL